MVSELLCIEEWFSFSALPGGGRAAEVTLAPASGHRVCPPSSPPHCHWLMAGLVGEKTGSGVRSIMRWWVTGGAGRRPCGEVGCSPELGPQEGQGGLYKNQNHL